MTRETATRENCDPLAGLCCLILEDESLIALDYERILRSAGAKSVISLGRLADAYALVKNRAPFDLVFLDVDLDGESSLPLARTLIAEKIPVVIITGLFGKTARPSDLLTVPLLEKPFEERALLAASLQARLRAWQSNDQTAFDPAPEPTAPS
jgi:CheY-like chemotaxis protein